MRVLHVTESTCNSYKVLSSTSTTVAELESRGRAHSKKWSCRLDELDVEAYRFVARKEGIHLLEINFSRSVLINQLKHGLNLLFM
mmetsp:Transcript_20179/g.34159  ORF Transcript_20179/g.34159 Transcript_20179/m.34159 type:complete len:85 (-) Transcript_20179:1665-1919(-)